MGFLCTQAWLDEDGRHVWFMHDCGPNGIRQTTMLPTTWAMTAEPSGRVSPSVDCRGCGLHGFLYIEPKPEFVNYAR